VSAASHGQDLLALVHETGRVVRRGSVAALVAMCFMVTVAITLGFVVGMAISIVEAYYRFPSPSESPLFFAVMVVIASSLYALVPAFLQAGPLAAYGLVALGDTPEVGKTLRVALRALPRLALLDLLFVLLPVLAIGLAAPLVWEGKTGNRPVLTGLAMGVFAALVVWSHARLLLFWQVSYALKSAAPWRERPSSWRLGHDRFPLQLAATIAPYFVWIAAARPSAAASDFLDGGLARALPTIVAFAGAILFIFLRPAFAAAAYSVALGQPPEKAAS
jgi:hypothetical protein